MDSLAYMLINANWGQPLVFYSFHEYMLFQRQRAKLFSYWRNKKKICYENVLLIIDA